VALQSISIVTALMLDRNTLYATHRNFLLKQV